MAWTAQKTANSGISNGFIYQEVIYTDGKNTSVETERTRNMFDGWPDSIIQNRLAELNTLDTSKLTVGAPAPPVVPVVIPPTQDQIDRDTFAALCQTFKEAKAEFVGGVGKTDQAMLDSLAVQLKSTYKDEYAPLIVGLF